MQDVDEVQVERIVMPINVASIMGLLHAGENGRKVRLV